MAQPMTRVMAGWDGNCLHGPPPRAVAKEVTRRRVQSCHRAGSGQLVSFMATFVEGCSTPCTASSINTAVGSLLMVSHSHSFRDWKHSSPKQPGHPSNCAPIHSNMTGNS